MTQTFINNTFYYLFTFTLLFGIILYNPIGITFADEFSGLLLLVFFIYYVSQTKEWYFNKVFLFTLLIFTFYTAYSFYIGSNSKTAIITDLIIQMKPYLAFFAVYQLKPVFNFKQKKLLKDICLVIWFILAPLGLLGFISDKPIDMIMKHTTYFGAAIISLSLIYFFCGKFTLKEKIIFLIMLSVALGSGRSKIYGFVALAAVSVLYFGNVSNIKFSLKNILIVLLTLIIICYVAWDKINLYFVMGLTGEVEKDLIARFVLYSTSIDIFKDYMPFGSGLASFATHASGLYYSDIYMKYGIDHVWGISKANWSFIADTYYPSLAQFGVMGVTLYFAFWLYILKKSSFFFWKNKNPKYFILSLLIIGYIVIENIADASITSNRGYFMMMLLGLIMAELKQKEYEIKYQLKKENVLA